MSTPAHTSAHTSEPALIKGLSLTDAVLLLVGGVIGSGIFLTAGQIASSLKRPDLFMLVWIAGAAVSLLGCFAIAELAGMFPEAGGPYLFLKDAFGDLPAFLYGWMIFAVVQTGTIAALAVGFAQYFGAAFPALASTAPLLTLGPIVISVQRIVAVTAIASLTVANVYGLRRGADLVNLATWLKFLAIGSVILFGLTLGKGDWSHFRQPAAGASSHSLTLAAGFGVALISVFFAFDGWVYITWVGSEMKDAASNLPRALIIGISIVALIYLLMNVVYLYALPLDAVIASDAVVQSAVASMFSSRIAVWLSLMVALSCFGAMSSAILCTARIFYAMAHDGLFFKRMAEVHPRHHTPAFSLIAQGVWASVLALIGLYDQLLTYAIFMMILGYLASVAALFVLRRKLPNHPRPYRCTGYPYLPALYVLITGSWIVNTIVARPKESLAGIGIVLVGIPGFIYWEKQKKAGLMRDALSQ